MTPRERWKIAYRRYRVIRRERHKAMTDMMAAGTGVIFVPDDGGDPRHVPIEELFA